MAKSWMPIRPADCLARPDAVSVTVPARVQDPGAVRDRLDRAPVPTPVRRRPGRVRAALRQEPFHHLLPHLQVSVRGQGAGWRTKAVAVQVAGHHQSR